MLRSGVVSYAITFSQTTERGLPYVWSLVDKLKSAPWNVPDAALFFQRNLDVPTAVRRAQ